MGLTAPCWVTIVKGELMTHMMCPSGIALRMKYMMISYRNLFAPSLDNIDATNDKLDNRGAIKDKLNNIYGKSIDYSASVIEI